MDKSIVLVILAIITAALIPIAPKLLCFRIKVLRFLRLNWLANLHEKYFKGFVLGVRITLAVITVVMLAVGLS